VACLEELEEASPYPEVLSASSREEAFRSFLEVGAYPYPSSLVGASYSFQVEGVEV